MKLFAYNWYADMGKNCRYADIADADIIIGTPLITKLAKLAGHVKHVLNMTDKKLCTGLSIFGL